MIIPSSVLAATWIPFSVVLLVELVLCVVFVQYFASRKRRECGSFLVCILGLLVALLSSSLLPVDIFLVSFAKENGQFKEWAASKESRNEMNELMQYAYYGLYGLDMLFVFGILPFAFFYNQSRDEADEDNHLSSRCVSALKWTTAFVLFAALLLTLGALIPLRETPGSNSSISDLEWIIPKLGNDRGENSLALVVNIFTTLGVFFLCFYGAYGMAAMPVSWIFGRLSLESTRDDLVTSEQALKVRIESAKKRNGRIKEVARMEGELEDVRRQLGILEQMEAKWCCAKCFLLCRPFQFLAGLIFFAISLFVVGVIVTTNLDRILNGEGYRYGYVINGTAWVNPIDYVLTQLQVAFPIDYIVLVCLLVYIVMCVVAGIVHSGIRICCVSLYKIRPRKTKPEALLFLVYILIFSILAVNVLFFSIAPGYYSYGTQTWNNATVNGTKSVKCADHPKPEECVKTANADFLLAYFYKMWVFGAIYYWSNWLFVSIFLAGLVFRCARGRPKATDAHFQREYDSEDEDNEMSEDNDPLLPAFRP
ncbi:probable lysosomal cobalamin transporter [Symsagittifera roscoffensis]|uniref:probable lysosomal cobalamin transporter n=1 Tax=Symsagittifera roscoffensis TaxID=84072 RepID=UPI00307B46E0